MDGQTDSVSYRADVQWPWEAKWEEERYRQTDGENICGIADQQKKFHSCSLLSIRYYFGFLMTQ